MMAINFAQRLSLPLLAGAAWLTEAVAGEAPAADPVIEAVQPENKVSAFAYVGQFSATRFNEIVRLNTDFRSSWVGVVGVTRELVELAPALKFEGELQAAQHWGMQSHQEVNALVALRWTRFVWDEFLPTTAAFGGGFSFATRPPALEDLPDRPASRTLVYLMLEIEVSPPDNPDWSAFARIHHRSGAYGAISNARGSNFVGLGLRARF